MNYKDALIAFLIGVFVFVLVDGIKDGFDKAISQREKYITKEIPCEVVKEGDKTFARCNWIVNKH